MNVLTKYEGRCHLAF